MIQELKDMQATLMDLTEDSKIDCYIENLKNINSTDPIERKLVTIKLKPQFALESNSVSYVPPTQIPESLENQAILKEIQEKITPADLVEDEFQYAADLEEEKEPALLSSSKYSEENRLKMREKYDESRKIMVFEMDL